VLVTIGLVGASAQQAPLPPPGRGATLYTVFLGQRALGREDVTVVREADGWVIRGTSQIGPPVDIVTRLAEIRYTADWRPTSMTIEGTTRGQETTIRTKFADGEAASEISIAGATPTNKVDKVSADTIVLPNAFLGSYAALSHRLVGSKAGATLRAYIAPQAELEVKVDGAFSEQIETPKQTIAATRYALVLAAPAPAPSLPVNVWADASGTLLRLSVPSQNLEIAREDIASAATRTSAFSIPGDEALRIPAVGFNLAATVTKPPKASGPLPALVLVGGSGTTDRDGFAAGIPVLGQLARDLVDAGFLVVRYDKRGVGQSGGRTEIATLADYAEDVRAILRWLEDRKDVDEDRIGLVGHSEGALVAMLAAQRDKRVAALALVAGPSTTGAELVLEQQLHLLTQLKTPDKELQEKIALQKQINQAVITGQGWDELPATVRRAADVPWFQSYLLFDPAAVMKELRQPILIVQGALDTQVPPHHAEKLAELARARRRKAAVDIAIVPGVNHLLVPATTGEVDEYPTLGDKQVANAVTSSIGTWMARTFQAIKD
jgi:pimeloyl-ACP methyl ester carboxylesterase